MVRFTTTAIAVWILAAESVFAFAPSRPVGTKAFVQQQQHVMPKTTTTSLSMNLFDRFTRVAKANMDSVLKKLEDPEKIMGQALEDMQNDLIKVRQSYAEITATQRRLLKQKEQAEAVAEDWYKRAQLALQKANEGLAKEALT